MSERDRGPGAARSRASRLFGKRLLSQPSAASGHGPEPAAPARIEPPAFARPPAPQPPGVRPTASQPTMSRPTVSRPTASHPAASHPAVSHPAVSQPAAAPIAPRPALTRPGPLGSAINPRAPGRVLVVGGDIRFSGDIASCERLIVEGGVDGQIAETDKLHIAESGRVRGKATVATCEVRGVFEGELTVLGLLTVRAGGRVRGTVRYAEVMVERGGTLTGDVDLRGPQRTAAPAPETAAPGPPGPRPA